MKEPMEKASGKDLLLMFAVTILILGSGCLVLYLCTNLVDWLEWDWLEWDNLGHATLTFIVILACWIYDRISSK